MPERFRDQIVWVTGASSGIGESLAIAFSQEGARLVLSSRNERELERVRQLCREPAKHRVQPLDLMVPHQIEAAAKAVLTTCGQVDVLVHSGGVSQRAAAIDTDIATDRAIMELNYFGTIALTKAVLPSMIARGSGRIVPISSVIGHVGIPGRSAYAASKHALHGFFDALRAEVAASGVKVTIICPGYVRTNVSKNALRGDGSQHGTTDETHARAMSPEVAARRMIAGIARGTNEVHVGGPEIMAIALKRLSPRLVARVLKARAARAPQ